MNDAPQSAMEAKGPNPNSLFKTSCRIGVLAALGLLYFVPQYYDLNAGRSRYLLEWLWREGWGKAGSSDWLWLAFLAGFGILKRKVLFGPADTEASTTHRRLGFFPLGALALYLLGHRMGALPLVALSGVLAVIGLCRALFPAAQTRGVLALASLVWVIPGLLSPLQQPLQLLTARLTVPLVGLFAHVRRSGTFLMLGQNEDAVLFWVSNECSGLSALKTLALLAIGIAMVTNLRSRRGASLLILAVAIGSLATNLMRVFIVLGSAHWFGRTFAMSLHDNWAGHIALVMVLLTGQYIHATMAKQGWLR